jgi:N-acyl homoserine lactone hydrolase
VGDLVHGRDRHAVIRSAEVRRVRFGTIVRPAEEAADGRARVEALDGFLVPLGAGLLLFDTGIGAGDPEVDAHYRPQRVALRDALAAAGASPEEVVAVANCHLHLDHGGGNAELAGRPVLVQREELALARTEGHTIAGIADFPGARHEVLDGETELAPGLRLIPTPGHTAGHQSLLVETEKGGLLLAGQTHDTASGWTADVEGVRRPDAPVPPPPAWLPDLLGRVAEARFAHDAAVWHA